MQAIKSYSPELIVHGCLKEQQPETEAREAQVEASPTAAAYASAPLSRTAARPWCSGSPCAEVPTCTCTCTRSLRYMHVYMHAHEVNTRWRRSVSGSPRYPRWSWGRDSDATRRCRHVLQRRPACTHGANLDSLTPSPTRSVSCPVCVPCMASCSW